MAEEAAYQESWVPCAGGVEYASVTHRGCLEKREKHFIRHVVHGKAPIGDSSKGLGRSQYPATYRGH